MSKKMGFWAVFALVTGTQIGSGVFMLPTTLAPYGAYSLVGWTISGLGAISLALVFAMLCARFPSTGGPHVYANRAFGPIISYFTGWTYWVISWVSTSAVVITCIEYLNPFLPKIEYFTPLVWQTILLICVTLLNLRGVKTAAKVEFWLTIFKFIPLIFIPIIAVFSFDINNFTGDITREASEISHDIGHVVLLTLWGFIGLESATTSAGEVENARITVPKAIVFGTISVAMLYIVNNVAIMGLIPTQELIISKAPYAEAAKKLSNSNGYILMSLVASIACLGTLNAWILTSGQIALGLAEDGFMPSIFGKKNVNDAPYWSLIISSLGILPLLILTANHKFAEQITNIIDVSVTAFLFVYLICCLALLKVLIKTPVNYYYLKILLCATAISFCLWVIFKTPISTLMIASMFVLSGLPIFLINHKKYFSSSL